MQTDPEETIANDKTFTQGNFTLISADGVRFRVASDLLSVHR